MVEPGCTCFGEVLDGVAPLLTACAEMGTEDGLDRGAFAGDDAARIDRR